MLKNAIVLFTLFLFFNNQGQLNARPSSYPYISGDTFRAFCDYIYDETGSTVVPEEVQYGETIFIKTDLLGNFFGEVHNRIANPYVLVTHNGDLPVPREYQYNLDDPKILAWYGQNAITTSHSKLYPLPIGIANRYWGHGSIEAVSEVQENTKAIDKGIFLYMNFNIGTFPSERTYVYELFKDKPFCTVSGGKNFRSYLFDLSNSKFVFCPRGNGMDCHRTWESILFGAIPIVISSPLDSLYAGLPILIINDWNEVTEEFLHAKWNEMSHCEYQLEKMYAQYWLDILSSFKGKK